MSKKKADAKFDLISLAEYEKTAEISYVQVSDGSEIRILQSLTKAVKKDPFTLVLVAGWVSLVLGWDNFLLDAQKHFNILYIETREKGSSKITKTAEFDIERFALDIKEIFEFLDLKQEKVVMLTSSFSAMLVAYMLKNGMIDPYLSVFIGPIEKVPIPRSIRILIVIVPLWLSSIVKIIGIWWVKNFKAEDEEHGAKYARSIRESDPIKWKRASKYFAQRDFWDVYKGIDNRVLIVDESVDRLHNTEITQEITQMIKNSEYIDLKTNKNTHSKPMLDTILEYLKKK